MRVIHLSKRQRQKLQEAALKAKAQSDARKAVTDVLEAVRGPERERRADALLEAVVVAHATVHNPAATASLVGREIGRLTPTTSKSPAHEAGEALFSKRVA